VQKYMGFYGINEVFLNAPMTRVYIFT